MESKLACSICGADFDIDSEGGQEGYIGMIPVAFCPYCVTGIIEFAEFMLADRAEID